MKRLLILEDGSVYEGEGFGSSQYQMGELVFNTGMSGYQEVLSDLSYCGQIVMMTYPMIGNYGVNRDDFESLDPAVFGFVVRECCNAPSNWRSDYTLDEFLKQKGIPGYPGDRHKSDHKKTAQQWNDEGNHGRCGCQCRGSCCLSEKSRADA